jgi:hypothetical protein
LTRLGSLVSIFDICLRPSNAYNADYDFPETIPMKGETLDSKPFLRAYVREFLKLCQEVCPAVNSYQLTLMVSGFQDEEVAVKHYSVGARLAPATINMHPLLVAKVAWRAWRTIL